MVGRLGNLVRSLFLVTAAAFLPSVFGSGCIDEAIIDDDDSAEDTTRDYSCLYSPGVGVGLHTTGGAEHYGIESRVTLSPHVEFEDGYDASNTDFPGFGDVEAELVGIGYLDENPYSVGDSTAVELIEEPGYGRVHATYDGESFPCPDGTAAEAAECDEDGANIAYYALELATGDHLSNGLPFPHEGASNDQNTWQFIVAGVPSGDLETYVIPDQGMDGIGGITVGVYGPEIEGIVCNGPAFNPDYETEDGDIVE